MSLLYRNAFQTAGKIGSCRIAETIVIAGSPRSGTTLIQEALQEIPDYKALNEPLLRRETQRRHGFSSRAYIPLGAEAPQQKAFLERALTGRLGHDARWAMRSETPIGRLREHASRKKLLVKFCRINRMLPWFAETFQTRGILFVVRHPCSVISSMIKFGQWNVDYVGQPQGPDSPLYLANLAPQTREVFEPIVSEIKTHAEALAAIWCLDHYIPLVEAKSRPWILLPYERLVRSGREQLDRVMRGFGVEVNERMVRLLDKPSSSVKGELDRDVDKQLAKWRRNLTASEIDGILDIVDRSGLSRFYHDANEPNYDALNALQRADTRWPSTPNTVEALQP